MKHQKLTKIFLIVISSLFLAMTATGCANTSKSEHTTPLKLENKLTKNGKISKKQLASIANKNKYYDFSGKSNGIRYTWTFFGKQIKNPTTQQLGLQINKNTNELNKVKKAAGNAPYAVSLKIRKFQLAGQPSLTITVPKSWRANHLLVLTKQNGELRQIPTANPAISIISGKTILNFNLTTTGKTIYLVAGQTTNKKILQKNANAEKMYQAINRAHKKEILVQKRSGRTKLVTTKARTSTSKNSASSSNKEDSTNSKKSSSKPDNDNNSKNDATESENINNESPENSQPESSKYVTVSIDCKSLLGHLDDLKESKRNFVPKSGVIVSPTRIKLNSGDTVYDILVRATKKFRIQMEASWTPVYNSYYIEGINQLYEFDAGSLSGWMFNINGWYPNYGASAYNSLSDGDIVEWRYTRQLGKDINAN